MSKPVCVVVGAGPGNGAAFGRRFVDAGYRVALLARGADKVHAMAGELGDDARGYAYDASDPDAAAGVFDRIAGELGPVNTLIYNAGSGSFRTIDGATVEDFEMGWRTNALGCVIAAKQVIPGMRKARGGNIVVIGATASLRGGARAAPFASAKAAQRSLTQSLARQLGPEGIHVAYVVIDGVIDLERTRARMPDKPDDFFLQPGHIAGAVHYLTQQPRSAWTFELDVRPFGESW